KDGGPVGVRKPRDLRSDTRLADPRLAGEQRRAQQTVLASFPPGRARPRELRLATYERSSVAGPKPGREHRRWGLLAQRSRTLARHARGRHPELAPQPLSQPLIREQGGGAVARLGLSCHEGAVRLLRQRVALDAAARDGQRPGGVLSGGLHAFEQRVLGMLL